MAEYIEKSVFGDIKKGVFSDALMYQETEISGKEIKDLSLKKSILLEIQMAKLQATTEEILKNSRIQPNRELTDWECEGAFLPESYQPKLFSWEMCNYPQEIGYESEHPRTVSVSYSKNKDFEIDIDSFPVSEGEKTERMRYNETLREWLNLRKDWVMLKAYAEYHDEKQKVKIPFRLLIALKN